MVRQSELIKRQHINKEADRKDTTLITYTSSERKHIYNADNERRKVALPIFNFPERDIWRTPYRRTGIQDLHVMRWQHVDMHNPYI